MFIVDSEITFPEWVSERSPDVATEDLATFAEAADSGSGISNILLYAFGAQPSEPVTRELMPELKIVDGHLGIEFTRLPAARDVRYLVEIADTMGEWSAASSKVEDISHTLSSNDVRRALFRMTDPMTTSGHGFLRVRVIYQP